MMKRRHKFVISVTFDKPCTLGDALAMVKDSIHGEFYPDTWGKGDKYPGEFTVRGVNRLPGGPIQPTSAENLKRLPEFARALYDELPPHAKGLMKHYGDQLLTMTGPDAMSSFGSMSKGTLQKVIAVLDRHGVKHRLKEGGEA